jgi:steroid delta-isomerase-like uncharacterized protein
MSLTDTVHKINEAFNRHDTGALADFYATDAVVSDPFYTAPLRGKSEIQRDAGDFFRAFPDIKGKIRTVIAKDQAASVQYTVTATHTGPLASPDGDIPPTGKKITLDLAIFSRFNEKGLIIEEDRYYNVRLLLEQLGLAVGQEAG